MKLMREREGYIRNVSLFFFKESTRRYILSTDKHYKEKSHYTLSPEWKKKPRVKEVPDLLRTPDKAHVGKYYAFAIKVDSRTFQFTS